jgi:hypothetical protein
LAAFFPHLNHVLRRAGLATATTGGSHAFFHHLANNLRRATLWTTTLATFGRGALFEFGYALGAVAMLTAIRIVAALCVFATFSIATSAMCSIIIRHQGRAGSRPD